MGKNKKNEIIVWLLDNPNVIILALLIVLMSLFVDNFFKVSNMLAVLQQISIIGIAAVGLTFAIIAGGNDLSVGSVMAFSAVTAGLTINHLNAGPVSLTIIGVLVGITAGLLIGLINGILIVNIGVNAFIMTLIMQMLIEGIGIYITNANAVSGFPAPFLAIGSGSLLGIPISIYLLAAFCVLGQILLKTTIFGRKIYTVGANERAARLVGINTRKVRITTFLMCSGCASVGGLLMASRIGAATAGMGSYIFLDIMSAVIIGGTSLFGGKGDIIGTFSGVIILGLISNGMNLLNIEYNATLVVKGAIIMLAITFTVVKEKLKNKRMLIDASDSA